MLHGIMTTTTTRTNTIIVVVGAALLVGAMGIYMIATVAPVRAQGDNDPFTKSGNPHDQPGAGDGDPHIDHKTGDPHRCPGATC
jgi:hypothetical protein